MWDDRDNESGLHEEEGRHEYDLDYWLFDALPVDRNELLSADREATQALCG